MSVRCKAGPAAWDKIAGGHNTRFPIFCFPFCLVIHLNYSWITLSLPIVNLEGKTPSNRRRIRGHDPNSPEFGIVSPSSWIRRQLRILFSRKRRNLCIIQVREVRTAGGEKRRPLISLLTGSISRRYVFGEANCPNRELKAERLLNSRCWLCPIRILETF